MNNFKRYLGLALIAIGAILLIVCKVAGWQSNPELLIGLSFIILGFILHLWLQKRGEKY
jgi:hypothetical protein